MKKLTFLIAILLLMLSSCTVDYDESKVNNSEYMTTVEIQNSIIDSCAVLSEANGVIYVLDEDNLVTHQLKGNNGGYVQVHALYFMLSTILLIILVITAIFTKLD
jgi:hypothetical protein